MTILATSGKSAGAAWQFPISASKLTPQVQYEGQATQVTLASSAGTLAWTVQQNGRHIAEITASASGEDRLTATLTAAATGRFQFALSATLNKARPLAVNDRFGTPGTYTLHYPYDWEAAQPIHARRQRDGQDVANVAPIELVVPGFESDGRFYAVDTWKLTKLVFHVDTSATSVAIAKTVETNVGYDTVTPDLTLSAGAATSLSLLSAPSLKALSVARFGEPHPVGGRLTFVYNKGWPCAAARCGIDAADYDSFATDLHGSFDLAIIRSYDPSQAIAQAFRRQGIDAYYYMFLGAERRSEGNRFRHDDLVSHDANGHQYGAPIVSETSSWGLLDIRRPAVRAELVRQAIAVLPLGYRGVFFDGPAFWLGSDGHVGGASVGATMSWTFARALLLRETRAALVAANRDARVGILGDRFYDGQALADFCLKESYGENWISIDPNPDARSLRNAPWINEAYDHSYRPYVTNSLFIGQKGSNPLWVRAGLKWGSAHGNWFTEVGDVYPIEGSFHISMERLGWILRDNIRYAEAPSGVKVVSIDPSDAAVITAGPSVLGAKDPVSIKLSQPTPVLSMTDKSVQTTALVHLDNVKSVIVAERHDGTWFWSGYGFAYRDQDTYVYGDVILRGAPEGSVGGRIMLHVATSPGVMAKKAPMVALSLQPSRTLVVHAPMPRSVTVKTSDDKIIESSVQPGRSGEFEIALPSTPAFAAFDIALDYASGDRSSGRAAADHP